MSTTTWYKVNPWSTAKTIKAIEVLRETSAFLVVPDSWKKGATRRIAKVSNCESFYPSMAEALAALRGRHSESIDFRRQEIKRCKRQIADDEAALVEIDEALKALDGEGVTT